MKKYGLVGLLMCSAFLFGFGVKSGFDSGNNKDQLKRVTGIGGIFFKCKDPKKMRDWYRTHLGLDTNPYGATFEWYQSADTSSRAQTQWTPFPETSKYFGKADQAFMINYRVAHLEELIAALRKEGVTVVDTMEVYDYGKFVHILDAEGNKVQLWEPAE